MSKEETPDAQWNMATATLKRLNGLLWQASYFAQAQDFAKWFYTLLDIKRNIAPFLEQEDYEGISNSISSLGSGWIMPNGSLHPETHAKSHRILNDSHELMIRAMHKKGLLMPKPDDPRFALDQ